MRTSYFLEIFKNVKIFKMTYKSFVIYKSEKGKLEAVYSQMLPKHLYDNVYTKHTGMLKLDLIDANDEIKPCYYL